MRKIYAVKDIKACSFGPVFLFATDAEAVRALTHTVNAPGDSHLFHNPGDFELYRLGTYNDASGAVSADDFGFVVNCGALKRGVGAQSDIDDFGRRE